MIGGAVYGFSASSWLYGVARVDAERCVVADET
jgi:hypothetical protein